MSHSRITLQMSESSVKEPEKIPFSILKLVSNIDPKAICQNGSDTFGGQHCNVSVMSLWDEVRFPMFIERFSHSFVSEYFMQLW